MGAKRRLSLDSVKAITNDVTSCVLFFWWYIVFGWEGAGQGCGLNLIYKCNIHVLKFVTYLKQFEKVRYA